MNVTNLLVAISLLLLSAAGNAEMQKHYSDEELMEILKNDGYRAVEKSDDRIIQIKVDGQLYFMYVYGDDDLQLYYGLTDYVISAEDLNTWNRTRRLSRAYLDTENDPILEADLLANSGLEPKQITAWLSVFVGSAQAFRQFLNEHDQSE